MLFFRNDKSIIDYINLSCFYFLKKIFLFFWGAKFESFDVEFSLHDSRSKSIFVSMYCISILYNECKLNYMLGKVMEFFHVFLENTICRGCLLYFAVREDKERGFGAH